MKVCQCQEKPSRQQLCLKLPCGVWQTAANLSNSEDDVTIPGRLSHGNRVSLRLTWEKDKDLISIVISTEEDHDVFNEDEGCCYCVVSSTCLIKSEGLSESEVVGDALTGITTQEGSMSAMNLQTCDTQPGDGRGEDYESKQHILLQDFDAQSVKNIYSVSDEKELFLHSLNIDDYTHNRIREAGKKDVPGTITVLVPDSTHSEEVNKKKSKVVSEQEKIKKEDKVLSENMRGRESVAIGEELYSSRGGLCCELCGKHYNSYPGWRDHVAMEHGEARYTCVTCGQGFQSVTLYRSHVLAHSDVKQYVCDQCGRSFVHKKDLKFHVAAKHKLTAHQCHLCPKKYSYPRGLVKHMKACHPNEQNVCVTCCKTFAHKNELRQHQISLGHRRQNGTGTQSKRHTCDTCGQGFQSATLYRAHALAHDNVKEYSCNQCASSFVHNKDLKHHVQIKHNNITHQCQLCPKIFSYMTSLKRHYKCSHSSPGTGQVTCGTCLKTFTCKGGLKRHQMTTGHT